MGPIAQSLENNLQSTNIKPMISCRCLLKCENPFTRQTVVRYCMHLQHMKHINMQSRYVQIYIYIVYWRNMTTLLQSWKRLLKWLTSPLITELPDSTLEITGTAVCQQIVQAQRQTYFEQVDTKCLGYGNKIRAPCTPIMFLCSHITWMCSAKNENM